MKINTILFALIVLFGCSENETSQSGNSSTKGAETEERWSMVGTWGKVYYLSNGTYTLNGDNTFVFEDSNYGKITGKWQVDQAEVIFYYDVQKNKNGTPHNLSSKTDIVVCTSSKKNEIVGYLKGDVLRSELILRRKF